MRIRECKSFDIKKELTKAQIRELATIGVFIAEEKITRRIKCKKQS